ncbi:MAG: NADH-quinone oxidoreductase subunit J [Pirellulales bacterium]|nr:NADH-quinone oxidoreductase subunit J [Pirellulales bacterium]
MEAINWHSCFFLLFAILSCGFAVAVAVSDNIVRMAVYLIASLAAVSGLFFLAGADFVGAMQLMIYVGGTLVLLAFGVMLTARGPLVKIATGGGQWVLGAMLGGGLLVILLQAAFSVEAWQRPEVTPEVAQGEDLATAAPLGMGMMGIRVDQLDETDTVKRGGMSGYLLPFEIVSVHLLVALIGAAYLARARRPAHLVQSGDGGKGDRRPEGGDR